MGVYSTINECLHGSSNTREHRRYFPDRSCGEKHEKHEKQKIYQSTYIPALSSEHNSFEQTFL